MLRLKMTSGLLQNLREQSPADISLLNLLKTLLSRGNDDFSLFCQECLGQMVLSEKREMDSSFIKSRLTVALKQPISEEQATVLAAHFNYIIKQNSTLNLTRICDEQAGIVLHIEDSLTALPELNAAPRGELVDLGSGGGFPGIPLLVMTARTGTLIEATAKKAHVLWNFVKENGLEGKITVEAQRIEEVARIKGGCFAVATARAVSSLPALMELASPLLFEGGVLLAYKGNLTTAELDRARSLEKVLGMKVMGTRSFILSDGVTKRVLVQMGKKGVVRRTLPRRDGQAQHHPLA
jgi:16S rRNA (guanine527-N7)-methyltransferase